MLSVEPGNVGETNVHSPGVGGIGSPGWAPREWRGGEQFLGRLRCGLTQGENGVGSLGWSLCFSMRMQPAWSAWREGLALQQEAAPLVLEA